jgi:hypothetical protein
MTATGSIKVTVTTPDGKPNGLAFISLLAAQGNSTNWGGGAKVGPDGTYIFKSVPPGRYTISPNFIMPRGFGDQKSDPAAKNIEVKEGQLTDVQLTK